MDELVSVYMPTRNRSELAWRAINSVMEQDYPNWELVIVDDASHDDTPEMLAEAATRNRKIIVLRNETICGAPASRNRAIRATTGRLITGLDDDDYFLPDRLSSLTRVFSDVYSFVCSDELVTTDNTSFKTKKTRHRLLTKDRMLYANSATNQVLTKREYLLDAGLFDEKLSACQDYDMWLRLVLKYGPGYRIPEPTIVFDQTPARNRISTDQQKIEGFERFIEKHRHLMSRSQRRAQQVRLILARENKLSLRNFFMHTSRGTWLRDLRIMLKGYFLK